MPKIIIPNAYEYYHSNDCITFEEHRKRYLYSLRFVWLLEQHDIIILPSVPPQNLLGYVASIKKFSLADITILTLCDQMNADYKGNLLQPPLIAALRHAMQAQANWKIQACYFHKIVLQLADALAISLSKSWRAFIEKDFCKLTNGKKFFRELAKKLALPMPDGKICHSVSELINAIHILQNQSSQLILKQNFNASGKGNLGIIFSAEKNFVGVSKIIHAKNKSLKQLAQKLWEDYSQDDCLIVEMFYPNCETFTVGFYIHQENIVMTHCAKIKMQRSWTGIEISLASRHPKLRHDAFAFARALQKLGYQGYLCCDAIMTADKKIFFTEINVRAGAETNAILFAENCLPPDYAANFVVTTATLPAVVDFSKESYLNHDHQIGYAPIVFDARHSSTVEFIIVAKTDAKVDEIEQNVARVE